MCPAAERSPTENQSPMFIYACQRELSNHPQRGVTGVCAVEKQGLIEKLMPGTTIAVCRMNGRSSDYAAVANLHRRQSALRPS